MHALHTLNMVNKGTRRYEKWGVKEDHPPVGNNTVQQS